jgi:hypothetical protein
VATQEVPWIDPPQHVPPAAMFFLSHSLYSPPENPVAILFTQYYILVIIRDNSYMGGCGQD